MPPLLTQIPPGQDKLLTRNGIKKHMSRLGIHLSDMEISALFRSLPQKDGRVSLAQLQEQVCPMIPRAARQTTARPSTAGSRLQSYAPPQDTFQTTQRMAEYNVCLPEAKDAAYFNLDERGTLTEFRRRIVDKLKSARVGGENRDQLNATTKDDPFMHTRSYGDKTHEQRPDETREWGRYSLHNFTQNRDQERSTKSVELQETQFDPEILQALGLQGNKGPPARDRRPLSASNAYRDKNKSRNPFCLSFRDFCVYVRRELGLRLSPIALRKLYAAFDPYGDGFVNLLDVLPSDIVNRAQRGPPRQAWSQSSGSSFERQMAKDREGHHPRHQRQVLYLDDEKQQDDEVESDDGSYRRENERQEQASRNSSRSRALSQRSNSLDTREHVDDEDRKSRSSEGRRSQSTRGSREEARQSRKESSQIRNQRTKRYKELYHTDKNRAEDPFSFQEKNDQQKLRGTYHRADTKPAGLNTAELNSAEPVSAKHGTTQNDRAHKEAIRNISPTIAHLYDEGKLPQPPATPPRERGIDLNHPNLDPNMQRALMQEKEKRRQQRQEAYEEAKQLNRTLDERDESLDRYKDSHMGRVDMADATSRYRPQQQTRFEDTRPASSETEQSHYQDGGSHGRPSTAESSQSSQSVESAGGGKWMIVYDSHGRPSKKKVDTSHATNPKLLGVFTQRPSKTQRPQSAPSGHHHHHTYAQTINRAQSLGKTLNIEGVGLQPKTPGSSGCKLPPETYVKGMDTTDSRAKTYKEVMSPYHRRAATQFENERRKKIQADAEKKIRNTHSVFRNTLRDAMRLHDDWSEASSYPVSNMSENSYREIPTAQRRIRVAKPMGRTH